MTDYSLVKPEDLEFSEEEVEENAEAIASSIVIGMPTDLSPAQARVWIKNCAKVHSKVAMTLMVMISQKRPTLQ